jgi:hypothetical protein
MGARTHWSGRTAAVAAVLAAALAAGCGGDDYASGGGGGASPPALPSDGGPSDGGPSEPQYGGLEEYKRRCERINASGARARIDYERATTMKVGDASTIRAGVTLDERVPPERLLRRTDVASASGLVVSCTLQARLAGPEDEFEIDETGWISRALVASDQATWVWSVRPKLGGDHTLTVFLRPIVRRRESGAQTEVDLATDAEIRDYETQVHVDVPWNEKPEELMTQLASALDVAEGLVKALTALVVAVGALLAAVATVRARRRRRGAHGAGPS